MPKNQPNPRRVPWIKRAEELKIATLALRKSKMNVISSPQNLIRLRREIISRVLNLTVKIALDNARLEEKTKRTTIQQALAEAYKRTPTNRIAIIYFNEATTAKILKHLGPTETTTLLNLVRLKVAVYSNKIEKESLERLRNNILRN